MTKTVIAFVIGTRPDIIKMKPIITAFETQASRTRINYDMRVVHTGQHYSASLAEITHIPWNVEHLIPDHKGSVADLFGPLVQATYAWCAYQRTKGIMVVYGDTLSALAAATGAKLAGWRIAHVEAGLRSGDLTMPEEVARMQIDAMSHYLFAPTTVQATHLKHSRAMGKVMVTGNSIYDVLSPRIYKPRGPSPNQILVTLHRRENSGNFIKLLKIISDIAYETSASEVLWPVHPSTPKISPHVLYELFDGRNVLLKACEPMNSNDFLDALQSSNFVMSDSGGIQEECAILGTPCITLRTTTERPETVTSGWNFLCHPNLDYGDKSPADAALEWLKIPAPTTNLRYTEVSPSNSIAEHLISSLTD